MINIKIMFRLKSVFLCFFADSDGYRSMKRERKKIEKKTNKELLLNYQMTIVTSSDKCRAMNSHVNLESKLFFFFSHLSEKGEARRKTTTSNK